MCWRDRQPKSTCITAESEHRPLHRDCSLFKEIVSTRPSRSYMKAVSRRSTLLKTAMSKLYPKIVALLWALLPQVDGSPALQSLVICLYCIASGMATHQFKMLCAQAFNILVARGPLSLQWHPAAGGHGSQASICGISRCSNLRLL